jgi:diguanylate cyclase (GGDEF)-like protein
LRLYVLLVLLLTAGFAVTSVGSYLSSRESIRQGITLHELPLTADTIYSEIQKDLIRPVFVSSMMASDTFLRHWVLSGENDVSKVSQYLSDIKSRFGAVTTFFVSEKTHRYYYPEGVLKTVRDDVARDAWFWRVRTMKEPYETNVDPDLARGDALTIFINYRVFDFDGAFLGAAGIGLTVKSVEDFIRTYQSRYDRRVYFVSPSGQVALSAEASRPVGQDLRKASFPWAAVQKVRAGGAVAAEYQEGPAHYLASVRYLPELKWYLVVEKDEGPALEGIQNSLWINLSLCLAVTAVVVGLFGFTVGGYQRRLERLAWTDSLTGLPNRPAVEAGLLGALKEARKTGEPLVLGIVDADHFKDVNDRFGHEAGDRTLRDLAGFLRDGTRDGDLVGRWGGEEFLILLRGCSVPDGQRRFQALVDRVDQGPWTRPEGAVTISIGMAGLAGGEDLSAWLSRADRALYQAKSGGRHRVEAAG